MNIKNKKYIIALIKKIAEGELPAFDPGDDKPSATTYSGAGKQSFTGYVSDPEVIKMQTALINLATTVNNQIKVKDIGKDVGSWGRTSFGDFVVKHYMRGSGEGVESSMDPEKVKQDKSTQTGPNRMMSIMDTMSRIGGTNIETQFKPDGKWGPKTNDGLHNAKAFAYSMLKLAIDFNLQLKSYSNENLTQFVIPEKDTDYSNEQKHIEAPKLTSHINKIIEMFNEIKNGVLEHPDNINYIESKKPYITYKKKTPLPPKMLDFLMSNRHKKYDIDLSMKQPGNDNVILKAKMNYQDLVSPEFFKKWMDSPEAAEFKGVPTNDIMNAIREKLQSMSTAPSPEILKGNR